MRNDDSEKNIVVPQTTFMDKYLTGSLMDMRVFIGWFCLTQDLLDLE